MRSAILLFVFAAFGLCQPIEPRVTVGLTSFADDADTNYFTAGGAVRAYLSRRWSVEPEYLYMRHNGAFVQDRIHQFWGNVAFDFRDRERSVRPYWLASPGVVHHRARFNRFTTATTEAAIAAGVGVRLGVGRFFVSPQFRWGLADGVFTEFTAGFGYVLRD